MSYLIHVVPVYIDNIFLFVSLQNKLGCLLHMFPHFLLICGLFGLSFLVFLFYKNIRSCKFLVLIS